ncbi:MAG TPA: Gfo/Idh/MocA family oxidoreductase [Bryobacteraceae bacterium]|nr:Gfo/Idh/MocA family oxidoreductase [Bryobacteraceae bacterium]
MKTIKVGMLGTGFMGKVHTEALRRLGNVEVAAVAGSSQAVAEKFATSYYVPKASGDWRALVDDPHIDAVHVCTPNVLHYPMVQAAIDAGKHILCEKPLTMTAAEARDLVASAARKKVANCVNHNLRFYPVVQQVRSMIAAGELGEILVVNGTYFQDWLLYDTDWNWRATAEAGGELRAMGDIGSHWMDMIQHLTGLKITALCADLTAFHKTRKRPKGSVETFAGKKLNPSDYESVAVTTDDFGAVLVRMGDRARGSFAVSQVSAGRKNRFQFEIYGTKSGVTWNQERPDELWIGHRNSPNQIIIKDASLFDARAATFADLPGGHSEGYDDTFKQMFRRFYARVADASAPVEYPTFEDGAWGMELLERVQESSQKQAWVKI